MNLPHARQRRGQRILFLTLGALLLIVLVTLSGYGKGDGAVKAVWQEATATPKAPVPGAHSGSAGTTDNTNCILCHTLPNLTGTIEDSSTLPLYVDMQEFESSVHGRLGCAACHSELTGYPHPKSVGGTVCGQCHASDDPQRTVNSQLIYPNQRAMSIAMKDSCAECHGEEYQEALHGMHTIEMVSGNVQAPVCADCHGSHNIQAVSRASFSDTCGDCHAAIYSSFQSSIHGASHEWVEAEDAPTCADCHNVHDIIGPRDPGFRQASVEGCLRCHQDEKKMARYDLQASVFNSDVDNFHAVALVAYKRADLEISGSAPVCYECHGVHNIQPAENPGSAVNVDNMTGTCRKCHDNMLRSTATAAQAHTNPSAPALQFLGWMSVYFIPGAFGLMMVYIVFDARKRWVETRRDAKHS